ncbi:MAG: hypothetical protein ACLTLQ_03485 [[Clostridium] scindens]
MNIKGKELKEQFYYGDEDPEYGHRLFFENSGGSLRLKKAVEVKCAVEQFPDCPERVRGRGYELQSYVKRRHKNSGELYSAQKRRAGDWNSQAPRAMHRAVGAIMEMWKMGNQRWLASSLEHPFRP